MPITKKIIVNFKLKDELRKVFKTSDVSLWRALSYNDDSATSRKIRHFALQKGAKKVFISEGDETFFDENGFMYQYISDRATLVANKETGTFTLFIEGVEIKNWKHVKVKDIAQIQAEAGLLALTSSAS